MKKTSNILLSYQPFYGLTLLKCKLRFTNKVPTAGVRIVIGIGLEMLINPEFFYLLSQEERVGLIWHELIHVASGHLVRYNGLEQETANIAMDESVNQMIPLKFLPKRAILPSHFKHETNKPFENYYNLHLNKDYVKKMQQKKIYEDIDLQEKIDALEKEIKKNIDNINQTLNKNERNEHNQKNEDNSLSKEQEKISEQLGKDKDLSEKTTDSLKEREQNLNDYEKNEIKECQNKINNSIQKINELKENNESMKKEDSSEELFEEGLPQVADSHELWNSDSSSIEEKKDTLRSFLDQVIEETIRLKGNNSIPIEAMETLKKLQKPKIKWENFIRNFIGRNLINDNEHSRRKPNRKFDTLLPGKVFASGPKVLLAFDVSGSVTDDDYKLLMAEVFGLTKEFLDKVMLVFFDTEIFKTQFMIDSNLKNIPKRPLRGGTDFQCVIDKAEEYKPNLVIILTDGCANPPKKTRIPILWAICGGVDNPKLPGQRILIESGKIIGSN